MSGNKDPSAIMAAEICSQISSIFSSPQLSSSALTVLVDEISAAARIFVHGVGREGLMLRAFCMRLYHLGLSAHVVGDVTTPPIASGDLLIASAGPGGFSTVDAISRVAKTAGARVVLVTAKPQSGSEACMMADAFAYLPAQTMADGEEGGAVGGVRLPMGSLFEGTMFVLFEMVVIRLTELLCRTESDLRSRHTNLE